MMKNSILFLSLLIALSACKQKNTTAPEKEAAELNILDKVAMAHGYENWNKVNEIRFTFNVDRDTNHFERTWIWKVKKGEVTRYQAGDTVSYQRKDMDPLMYEVNGGFINDKFWLMVPYNLVWDRDNFTYEHQNEAVAPLSGKPMQKLTIVYGSEGGYTPGDAYDLYFGDDHILQEWVFRKSNQAEPSLMTTWEDYATLNGLVISKTRKNDNPSYKLYFSDLAVD